MANGNIVTISGNKVIEISGTGYVDLIGFEIAPVELIIFPNPMESKTIPSYLYWEYNDDESLLAFIASFNAMSQEYIDWFNTINLPVYAGNPNLVGPLLDWMLTGLYGIPRPNLPSTQSRALGPYNTFPYNTNPYNVYVKPEITAVFTTTDDIYKRIATWNLYKGDGNVFSIMWLKRRIQRFLTGINGVDGSNPMGLGTGVDQTYAISVTFDASHNVTITVDTTASGNSVVWDTLKAALMSGACALPFQYTFNFV